MEKLVFATNNQHKLKEIRSILDGSFEVLGLSDIGCTADIPEEGTTLEENARIKARYVLENFRLDCFADDTGLEIVALNGRPGVHSARYAGNDCNAGNNIRKVLQEMEHEQNRKARFRTVICLLRKGAEHYFEGEVNGRIIREKRGDEGFGYDPVFIPDGYEVTFAEMPLEEKNKISHRGRATQKLIAWLMHHG